MDDGRDITARELNRATLARQLLLRREPLDAAEGVRRVVALQAQQPASPISPSGTGSRDSIRQVSTPRSRITPS